MSSISHDETLLAGATCRLFGRVFKGLSLGEVGSNGRIDFERKPTLARIYGFSWEGNYFKLAVPTVMLVYGPGEMVSSGIAGDWLSQIGIEFKDEFFAKDVKVWLAVETEFAVRIDITSGWLSEILIAPEASDATNTTGAGDGMTGARNRVIGRANLAARGANMVGRPPNS